MIQLNLLPDVKLEYIKAERERRLVIVVSTLATTVAIGILFLNFGFGQLQKKHLSDLNSDISTKSHKLQAQPEINKILTVQNQLKSLTALHDAKPAAGKMFDFLNQLTPVEVSISSLQMDYTTQIVTLSGSAKAISDVNRYVDTLKFTTYSTEFNKTDTKAFSNVVLSSFAVAANSTANALPVSYSVTFMNDPLLFSTVSPAKLKVPTQITTRSEISQPTDLFKAAAPKGTP